MAITQRLLVAVLSLLIGRSTAFADCFTVTLKVVDAGQKPVARAEAALFWPINDGSMAVLDQKRLATDGAGKARLLVEDNRIGKFPVLVLSADRKLGGIVGVSRADDGKELTIVLGPTVRVKGKLECKELKVPLEVTATSVIPEGFQQSFVYYLRGFLFGRSYGPPGEFEFVLPVGTYTFTTNAKPDVETTKRTAILTADRPEYDFGTIDMGLTPIGKMKGKPAPEWMIAEARGVRADVKLSDYRGKWVYLEFWGYW